MVRKTASVIEHYQKKAEAYNCFKNKLFYQQIARELLKIIPERQFNTILEVGGGSGFATSLLQQKYPQAKIVVLEPTKALFLQGQKKLPEAKWFNQTLASFQPQQRFDLVFASMSGHWLSSPELEKLINLSKDGCLALTLPSSICHSATSVNFHLKQLLFSLKTKPLWSKKTRSFKKQLQWLAPFSLVTMENLFIKEKFASQNELVDCLSSRGVFLALFGSQAETAQKWLIAKLRQVKGPLAFSWSIKLIAAKNK